MFKAYSGGSVLVTGGAGFIGSQVSYQLVKAGAQVTILDNLSTGSLSNIQDIKSDVTFIHGDIRDLSACLEAARNKSVIFHLAAVTSVPESVVTPLHCYNINVMGTLNMLEAARIQGSERFVFSSSAAVYGTQAIPCEELLVCKPESPYGFSKLMGEQLCKQYAYNYNIATVCLRYFNVFGQYQKNSSAYASVIARFREYMNKNEPITIFGNGLQTRDFVKVEEVAYANLMMPLLPKEEMQGAAINIGSGKSISLLELIEILKKDFPQFNAGIIFEPARLGDIQVSEANCSRYVFFKNNLAVLRSL